MNKNKSKTITGCNNKNGGPKPNMNMNTVRHSVGLYLNYHEIISLYPNASACSNISYSRYISIVNQITTTTAASEMSSFMISLYADIHTLVTLPWGKRVIVSFCSW